MYLEGKMGFVSPCSCGKTGLCLCLLIYNMYVETDRLMSVCVCADTLVQHGGKDVGEGVERLVCLCVCYCVWID